MPRPAVQLGRNGVGLGTAGARFPRTGLCGGYRQAWAPHLTVDLLVPAEPGAAARLAGPCLVPASSSIPASVPVFPHPHPCHISHFPSSPSLPHPHSWLVPVPCPRVSHISDFPSSLSLPILCPCLSPRCLPGSHRGHAAPGCTGSPQPRVLAEPVAGAEPQGSREGGPAAPAPCSMGRPSQCRISHGREGRDRCLPAALGLGEEILQNQDLFENTKKLPELGEGAATGKYLREIQRNRGWWVGGCDISHIYKIYRERKRPYLIIHVTCKIAALNSPAFSARWDAGTRRSPAQSARFVSFPRCFPPRRLLGPGPAARLRSPPRDPRASGGRCGARRAGLEGARKGRGAKSGKGQRGGAEGHFGGLGHPHAPSPSRGARANSLQVSRCSL